MKLRKRKITWDKINYNVYNYYILHFTLTDQIVAKVQVD